MSAFILGNEHITVILQAATPRYPGDSVSYYWNGEPHYVNGSIQDVGQRLVDENYRSVNYRYDEGEGAHSFRLVPTRSRKPVEIIKACDSYIYQTCECPDFEETEAFAIVQMLRNRAINALPGYEEADWSINC